MAANYSGDFCIGSSVHDYPGPRRVTPAGERVLGAHFLVGERKQPETQTLGAAVIAATDAEKIPELASSEQTV